MKHRYPKMVVESDWIAFANAEDSVPAETETEWHALFFHDSLVEFRSHSTISLRRQHFPVLGAFLWKGVPSWRLRYVTLLQPCGLITIPGSTGPFISILAKVFSVKILSCWGTSPAFLGEVTPRKLTWQCKTIWRCISHWIWRFSIVMLVFRGASP